MMKNLSQVNLGEEALVKSVSQSSLKSKLTELGIVENTAVKMVLKAPFGDPIAIDVEGYVLSLRKSEADLISVETL